MRNKETILKELKATENAVSEYKRKAAKLRRELAELADDYPRIARAKAPWSGISFVSGEYVRYPRVDGHPTYIEQPINHDGSLGATRKGVAISHGDGSDVSWLSKAEEVEIAQHHPNRQWSKRILAKHGITQR